VIHGLGGEQDMRRMGGLAQRMPWTRLTMLVGCIAIAGIPPLAGFFSKDEILWSAFRVGGHGQLVWGIGFAAALLTAFYMFRLYHMTFSGRFRGGEEAEHHIHESPRVMLVPLQVLALGSIVAGFLGVPVVLGGSNFIEHFLEPAFEGGHHALGEVFPAAPPGHGVELLLMAASVAIALVGILVASWFYAKRPELPERLATTFRAPHRLLLNKYYVDELYGAVFVRGGALGGGTALFAVDRFVIDGGDGEVRPGLGVNGSAWFTRDVAGKISDLWDKWVIDGAVNLTGAIFDNLSYLFRAVQNGLVQHYALVALIAVLFLIGASRFIQ